MVTRGFYFMLFQSSFFFVFNTILFFLIITTIYIYYQHNVSHNIADFSAPMGHKFVLLVERPPMHYGFTTPKMTDQTSKGPTPKRQKRPSAIQPSSMQSTHPSRTFGRIYNVYFPKLYGSLWKRSPTPFPQEASPSIHPLPSKKQSHNLCWFVLGH